MSDSQQGFSAGAPDAAGEKVGDVPAAGSIETGDLVRGSLVPGRGIGGIPEDAQSALLANLQTFAPPKSVPIGYVDPTNLYREMQTLEHELVQTRALLADAMKLLDGSRTEQT